MKWLSEIISPESLAEHTPELIQPLDEIAEFKKFAQDMAVIRNGVRRIGGTGDAKVIGEIPAALGPIIWQFEPEVFLSKKKMHEFLNRNPHFKLNT